MPQFLDRVERRQIDDDRAKAKDSVIGSHIMRDIWQEQPDPVAAPDPKAFQTASKAISRRGDFGIAIATAVEIDQRRLRGPRGRRGPHVRQAQGFDRAAPAGRMPVIIRPVVILVHAVWLAAQRSEYHTTDIQSLMRTSYAVFCSKQNKN